MADPSASVSAAKNDACSRSNLSSVEIESLEVLTAEEASDTSRPLLAIISAKSSFALASLESSSLRRCDVRPCVAIGELQRGQSADSILDLIAVTTCWPRVAQRPHV